jgi:hypothetical protein
VLVMGMPYDGLGRLEICHGRRAGGVAGWQRLWFWDIGHGSHRAEEGRSVSGWVSISTACNPASADMS